MSVIKRNFDTFCATRVPLQNGPASEAETGPFAGPAARSGGSIRQVETSF